MTIGEVLSACVSLAYVAGVMIVVFWALRKALTESRRHARVTPRGWVAVWAVVALGWINVVLDGGSPMSLVITTALTIAVFMRMRIENYGRDSSIEGSIRPDPDVEERRHQG